MPKGANGDTNSDDYLRADKLVRNVRNDEQAGIVLPPPTGDGTNDAWILELLPGGSSTKSVDADRVIARHEKRMLTAALAQFLILGQDKIGALSLSSDQTDFFTMALNALADVVSETFMQYPATRLLALNGYDADGIQLEHSPAGDMDISIIGDFLQKVGSKITWTADDEVMLRNIARLPTKTPEQIEEARANMPPPPPSFQFPPQMSMFTADTAPDVDNRETDERRWARRARQWFNEQEKRVIAGVK